MKTRLSFFVVFSVLLSAAFASCNKTSPTEPTPVCSYTLAPGNAGIPSDGGTGTVTITTMAGCSWTAAASDGWITITAGNSGQGSGTVTYSVAANASTTTRSGSVTVAGQSHAITQQGHAPATCTYEFSPVNADFTKDGGSGSVTVTAPTDCRWTASSSAPWLVITDSGQGSGAGTISYTVSRHIEIPDRTATIAVADRRFTVRQSGDVGICQYSVAPVLLTPCMAGGTVTATITTQPSCPWTATSDASWLSVLSGTSGNGPVTVSVSVADNYDAPRQGSVLVRWPTPTAGQNIQVAQAGCRYAVSTTAIGIVAAGGPGTFDVIQQSDPTACGGATQDRCVWTARSEVAWITITSSMPRSGDNPVSFTVAANDSPAPRIGTIVVRDKTVTVTQVGK
jgi:hypothetical protein